MRRVYKYPLTWNVRTSVDLPIHSEMLSVIIKKDIPVLYALVPIDKSESREIKVTVVILGTGHDFEDFRNYDFLQTIVYGSFVWHFFYKEDELI